MTVFGKVGQLKSRKRKSLPAVAGVSETTIPEAAAVTLKTVLESVEVVFGGQSIKLYEVTSVSSGDGACEVLVRASFTPAHILFSKWLLKNARETGLDLEINARLYTVATQMSGSSVDVVGYAWVMVLKTSGSIVRTMSKLVAMVWKVNSELGESGTDLYSEMNSLLDSVKEDFLAPEAYLGTSR